MLRRSMSVLLCFLILSLTALPSVGAAAATNNAHVRFLHAAPGVRNIDIHVDGNALLKGFAFQSVSDYAPLSSGKHQIELFATGEQKDPIFSEEFDLEAEVAVTAAVAGQGEDLHVELYPDQSGLRDNQASLRLIHLSPNAPTVDLATLGGQGLFTGIDALAASPYKELSPGELNLTINPSGNPEAPTVSEVALDLEPGKAYSAVLTGIAGAAPGLEVLLLEDGIVPGLPKTGLGGASPIVE